MAKCLIGNSVILIPVLTIAETLSARKMKITEINTISNYNSYGYDYWTKIIDLGYLIYRPLSNKVVIQNSESLEILKEIEIGENQSFAQTAFQDRIFLMIQNELYELETKTLTLELLYKSKEEYVGITFSQNSEYPILYYDGTYKRKPRIIRYNLINPTLNESIFQSQERIYLVDHFEDKGIFYERTSNNWILYDFTSKTNQWEIEIGDAVSGRRWFEFNPTNFLFETHFRKENKAKLQNRSTLDGKLNWQIENCLSHYHKIPNTENYIGLGGSRIHRFNSKGENETVDLNIDCSISSHLTTLISNDLIFCSHLNSNIPVIGQINIKNNEVESINEVQISEDKSFRIGLDVPHKANNKIYVRDSLNNLRIFKIE